MSKGLSHMVGILYSAPWCGGGALHFNFCRNLKTLGSQQAASFHGFLRIPKAKKTRCLQGGFSVSITCPRLFNRLSFSSTNFKTKQHFIWVNRRLTPGARSKGIYGACSLVQQFEWYSSERPRPKVKDDEGLAEGGQEEVTERSQGQDHDDVKEDKAAGGVPELHENIFTVPNFLCGVRISLTPVISYLVINSNFTWAMALFGLAGLTDLFDGYIARNFKNQSSAFGSYIDPLADKFLVSVVFLSLTYVGLIPVPLTLLIIGRDIGLILAGFYVRYKTLPPPVTFSRYFDATHATAQLKPTFISKVNTAVQLGMVTFSLAAPVLGYVEHPLLQALWYLTAGTTIMSGLSYLVYKDTFKVIRRMHRK
ncbi:cardiolipin synthase (CMP-forming)-like [Branchiostoma floridae]|uniref:Cardiolipin synthase (CMP-forming) n=1 Tax=Branchiostoma floridae TaxID=7739 RepID=A0A9J7MRJ6_BRAFL|nr:cardiolipin synthase (CMP-forming)-like [Branchiostoma floridae]